MQIGPDTRKDFSGFGDFGEVGKVANDKMGELADQVLDLGGLVSGLRGILADLLNEFTAIPGDIQEHMKLLLDDFENTPLNMWTIMLMEKVHHYLMDADGKLKSEFKSPFERNLERLNLSILRAQSQAEQSPASGRRWSIMRQDEQAESTGWGWDMLSRKKKEKRKSPAVFAFKEIDKLLFEAIINVILKACVTLGMNENLVPHIKRFISEVDDLLSLDKILEKKAEFLVNNLMLDPTNPMHLQYWAEKVYHSCCIPGGKKIENDGEIYRVPTGIHRMFEAVRTSSESGYDDLKEQLEVARHTKTWKSRINGLVRNKDTKDAYTAENIEFKQFTLGL